MTEQTETRTAAHKEIAQMIKYQRVIDEIDANPNLKPDEIQPLLETANSSLDAARRNAVEILATEEFRL